MVGAWEQAQRAKLIDGSEEGLHCLRTPLLYAIMLAISNDLNMYTFLVLCCLLCYWSLFVKRFINPPVLHSSPAVSWRGFWWLVAGGRDGEVGQGSARER